MAKLSEVNDIFCVTFTLLNPDTLLPVDVPSFEAGVGHNWGIRVESEVCDIDEVFADLDCFLDYISDNGLWYKMSYYCQYTLMELVRPVFTGGYYTSWPGGEKYVRWYRQGEE